MITWDEVIKNEKFQDLSTSEQAVVRSKWFDAVAVPKLKAAETPDDQIDYYRNKAVSEFDNGQGYVSSAIGSFARGVGSIVPGVVQGAGEVLGSEGLVQTGKEMQEGLENFAGINPSMTKTNFVAGAAGNAIGFLGPLGVGGLAAKGLGLAARTGAITAGYGSAGLSGAAEAGEEADQYDIAGDDRYLKVLSGAATEIGAEMIPFGLGGELKALRRVPGLKQMADEASYAGGIARAAAENAAEESLTQIGNNAATIALAPGQAPGLMDNVGSAALGGAIGGATFGALGMGGGSNPNVAAPANPPVPGVVPPIPSAPVAPGANREPINAPKVPNLFDDTINAPVPIPPGATIAGSAAEMTRATNNTSIGLAVMNDDTAAAGILKEVGDTVEAGGETTIFDPVPKEASPVEDTMPTKEELEDLTKQAEKAVPEVTLEGAKLDEQLDFESKLIDVQGKIDPKIAVQIAETLLPLAGLPNAKVTLNDTGTLAGEGKTSSTRGQVDPVTGDVALNRNNVTADTPVHEVLGHTALPQLEKLAPELFNEGVELMNGAAAPLKEAIKARYARAGIELSEAGLIDEFMATAYGNESAEFWERYVSDPKAIQKIRQWIAKVRLFFQKMLASKGVKPGMTVADWAKQVNRQVLAGAFKDGGKARTSSVKNSLPEKKPTPKIDLAAARARIQKASGPVSPNLPAPEVETKTPVPTHMRGVLGERAKKDIRNSLADPRDAKYLELAKDPEANKEELQRMVDAAAKVAGYDLSHRRRKNNPREAGFVMQFTEDRDANTSYGAHEYMVRSRDLPTIPEWVVEWYMQQPEFIDWADLNDIAEDNLREEARNALEPQNIVDSAGAWDSAATVSQLWNDNEDRLSGTWGFKTPDGAVVIDSTSAKIKSADPVTYDDKGEVIPLSQRFDATKKDIRNSLADPRMKDTGVGQGPHGGKTGKDVLTAGFQYLSGTYQEAMTKALELFEAVDADNGSYVGHSAKITQLTTPILGGGSDNMQLGAYIGLYTRKLNDIIRNSPDESDVSWATHDLNKLYENHVNVGAALGQLVKSLDFALLLANDPVRLTTYQELVANFGGKDEEAKKFKREVDIYHEVHSEFTNDTLGAADKDEVGAGAEQGVAATIKGEAAGDEAAAELEAIAADTTAPLEESAKDEEEDWYTKGVKLLDEKTKAFVEELTDLISLKAIIADHLRKTQSSLASDSSNRMAAKFAEMMAKPGASAQALLAETDVKIAATVKKLKNLTNPKVAKPAKGDKVPETDMATLAANRLVTAINAILTPEGRKKPENKREAILKAITQAVMAESGFSSDVMKYEGDMALTVGMLANNKDVIASAVRKAFDLLQSDEATRDITTHKRLEAFVQLAANTDVATRAAFGEKQMAKVLRDEMKALDRTITQVVKSAALSATTASDLEARLRDPKRQLEAKLGRGTLNDVIAAVQKEYAKTAQARMEQYMLEIAERNVKQQMERENRRLKAELKKAQDDVLRAMARHKTAQKAKDVKNTRDAEAEVKAAMKAVKDLERRDAEYEKMAARRMFLEKRRKDRVARRKDNQLPAQLTKSEMEALLEPRDGEKALEYLARQFGFDLKAIKAIISPEGQKTALEEKTKALGEALGLDAEQTSNFMAPVIKAAMDKISDAQKKKLTKDIEKRIAKKIEENGGPAQPKGKKRKVMSDNEKVIDIVMRGGLSRDNIEQMLLNTAGAQKFSDVFRKRMEDLAERMHDLNLPESARNEAKMDFLGSVRAETGVGFLGLWGEFAMSNIFMSLTSTLKVNAYAGGMGAAINSYITLNHVMPRLIAAAAKENGKAAPNGLLVRKLLARSLRIGVGSNMQNAASHMIYNGKSLDPNDSTLHFESSAQEQLAHFPNSAVVWPSGKPVPKWLEKTAKGVSRLSKYTRRTMAATDLYMRNGPQEMLKTAAVIQELVKDGKFPATYEAARVAIEKAQYGEPLKDAVAKAKRQAAGEVANKVTKKENQAARVAEILDSKLRDTIGLEKEEKVLAAARRITYANPSEGVPGVVSSWLTDIVKKIPGMNLFLPAIRMPIEFFAQSLEWTPLGFANALAVKRSKRGDSAFSPSETASIAYLLGVDTSGRRWKPLDAGTTEGRYIDLIAKATYGSTLMAVGIVLALLNKDDDDEEGFFVTAEGPKDPQARALFYERGERPFTVGYDKYRFNFMEMPAVAVLTTIGSLSDSLKYGKPDEDISAKIAYAMLHATESFSQQAVLRNLTDVLGGKGSGYSDKTGAENSLKKYLRAGSNLIAPRIGSEINQVLFGKLDNKTVTGMLFANVPFVPQMVNLPALDFFGEEIHQKAGGPLGEIYPMLNHRIGRTVSTDEQLQFVSKMGANKLDTSRRFIEDHSEVMKNYEFMRQWQKDAGKATREWLTPEVMARFNEMYKEDKKDAQSEFDKGLRKIRDNALRRTGKVVFTR